MNIGDLIASGIEGFMRRIIESIVEPGLNALLGTVTGSERITGFVFFEPLFQGCRIIGIAILTMLTMWSLCKVFFAFTGIDVDDPVHTGLQLLATTFLVWYSKDILLFAASLNEQFIGVIIGSGLGVQGGLMGAGSYLVTGLLAFFTTGALSITLFAFMIIPVLYCIYRTVRLLFRMFQRLMLEVFLIIASPLAFACGVSKATRGYQVGFMRVFVGNLVIQMVQTMGLMALGAYSFNGIIGLPSLITILGILYVLDRVEEIVRDLSFGIGAGRDTGSAISTVNTALHTVSNATRAYGTASRFIPGLPPLPAPTISVP